MAVRGRAARSDRGSVTAETAVALPALMLLVGVLLGLTRALALELAEQDAARVGARSAARGDPPATVRRLATAVAPRGARVSVVHDGALVRVRVESVLGVASGALAGLLPAVTLSAESVAADESASPAGGSR